LRSGEAQEDDKTAVEGEHLLVRQSFDTRPGRSRRMLVSLSTIVQQGAVNGNPALGEMPTRRSVASRFRVVSGQTTMLPVAL